MTLSSCKFVFLILLMFVLTEVYSALASETTLKATIITSFQSSYRKFCTHDSYCNGNNEYCNALINQCGCKEFFEYNFGDCSPCPLEGEVCLDCCYDSNLECIDNVCTRCVDSYGQKRCDKSQVLMSMTASQIALSATLLMGVAALAALLYRICTRSRRIRFGRRNTVPEIQSQRSSQASLSSIQVRVISQLLDRPPKYETQHNYDMRLQRQATTNADDNVLQGVHVEHAPPAYDGSRDSAHESPPPYSDTGHDILPEIVSVRINTNEEQPPSEANMSGISIISNSTAVKEAANSVTDAIDNKEDRSVHI